MPTILLITTTDILSARERELLRLFDSIELARKQSNLQIEHRILLQRSDGYDASWIDAYDVKVVRINGLVSLSKARNILLAPEFQAPASVEYQFVAFPDDDAWYVPGALALYSRLFEKNENVSLIVARYGEETCSAPDTDIVPAVASPNDIVTYSSSNTMAVRWSDAKLVGYFDEVLGLGAELNGGEDLDYALRAWSGKPGGALFWPEKIVGHRDKQKWMRGRYYYGSLFAIAKSMPKSWLLRVLFMRKLLVGIVLFFGRELNISDTKKFRLHWGRQLK